MLEERCFAGGITGNAGAFGGIGNGPEGRFGRVGIGRDGAAGKIGRGIFQPGCVFGSGKIPEMAAAAAGGAGGAGGCGGGNGGSNIEASSMLIGSTGGSVGNHVSMWTSP